MKMIYQIPFPEILALSKEVKRWVRENDLYQRPDQPIFGIVEEIGEYCRAVLKTSQGLMPFRTGEEKRLDALHDIGIFCLDMIGRLDMPERLMEEIYEDSPRYSYSHVSEDELSHVLALVGLAENLTVYYRRYFCKPLVLRALLDILETCRLISKFLNHDYWAGLNETWHHVVASRRKEGDTRYSTPNV